MHQRLQRCFIGGCNPRYAAFVAAHPGWRGRVNVLAHSLGSVIVLDMLSRAGTLFQGVRRTAIDPTVDHAMHHATHHATHRAMCRAMCRAFCRAMRCAMCPTMCRATCSAV